MTETNKSKLVNVVLVITTVLAVAVVVRFVHRGLRVRHDLAAEQTDPPVARTFAVVTVPMDAVKNLVDSVVAGDHDAALNRLVCTDEASQREAEAVFGAPALWQHFLQVSRQTFGKQVPPSSPGSPVLRTSNGIEKAMKGAWAKVYGERAQLSANGEVLFYLVRVKGDWKIDYDQTRGIMPSGLTVAEIDQTLVREGMLREVTADVQAGKYKSYAEVTAKLLELDSHFPMQPTAHYAVARTVKEAMDDFISAVGNEDVDAMFNRLLFESEHGRQEAVAEWALPFATRRFLTAAAERYGPDVPAAGDPKAAMAAAMAMRNAMQGATMKFQGDLAEMTEPSGNVMYFQSIDGDWKIDYDLLQKQDAHRLTLEEIDERCARYQVETDMIAELRAGAFPNFAAANEELERRVNAYLGTPSPRDAALLEMDRIRVALLTFQVDNKRYPTTAEGLKALVLPPEGAEDTWTQLMDRIPTDPWGNEYRYLFPREGNAADFDLISAGPDGQFGTEDDLHKNTRQ